MCTPAQGNFRCTLRLRRDGPPDSLMQRLHSNPDQNGQVLLLAGENGEGTEVAGKLVTDLPRFATTLKDVALPLLADCNT
jgi:hypothetical protein